MSDPTLPPPYRGPLPPAVGPVDPDPTAEPRPAPATGAAADDPLQLLVMCTANQCRSAMAAAIATDLLARTGAPAAVASCGLLESGHPASRSTVRAMERRGLDVSEHRSRQIDEGLVGWATLIIGMERRHVLRVVELDPSAIGRTFTLPELADLALLVGPRLPGHGPADWVARCAAARDPSSALSFSTALDVADPMGGPARGYRRTAEQIEAMLTTVLGMVYPGSV